MNRKAETPSAKQNDRLDPTSVIIASAGGINPAGRSSDHQAFLRVVYDALPAELQASSKAALATLTGNANNEANLNGTLVRAWDDDTHAVRGWSPEAMVFHQPVTESSDQGLRSSNRKPDLNNPSLNDPDLNTADLSKPSLNTSNARPLTESTAPLRTRDTGNTLETNPKKDNGISTYQVTYKRCAVQSAGQLPQGFHPGSLYKSKHHPRGLQMALYAAADALGNLGMSADELKQHLAPDDIAVYVGSTAGQLDMEGFGGMLCAPLLGQRNTSRQLPMGISTMPADFINAYLLGNAGSTGSNNGACASFLYNLRMALDDIRSGRRNLVLVGNSEAPLLAGIVEGFNAMGALATEERLQALQGCSSDKQTGMAPDAEITNHSQPDYRSASRPFADNVGFTLAESAQCFVLASRDTALELGLNILGGVGDVFIHADGYKKSISAPGIGNYITMGKAMASAQRALGKEALKQSFVQAHGSSTPQNRTTESDMLNRLANAFDLTDWPVCAVKAHLGHSISAASADQLLMTLGSWTHGILPGITTATAIAADVHQARLNIPLTHTTVARKDIDLAFINSKGFGGNNASAWVLSGHQVTARIQAESADNEWQTYLERNKVIKEKQQAYLTAVSRENLPLPYRVKEKQPEPHDIELSAEGMSLPGWSERIVF